MNVMALQGTVETEPKVFGTDNEGHHFQLAFFTMRVPGIKEDWQAAGYDDSICVQIPVHLLKTVFNSLKPGTMIYATGALRRGRYLTAAGRWEVTLGMDASDVVLLKGSGKSKEEKA